MVVNDGIEIREKRRSSGEIVVDVSVTADVVVLLILLQFHSKQRKGLWKGMLFIYISVIILSRKNIFLNFERIKRDGFYEYERFLISFAN